MVSEKSYQETLPKKRMGAGCLIFDEVGRVLLVKPTYKSTWEIPGGIVEQNEPPRACCQREILEELGFERVIGRLLAVDYNLATESKTESLMFIFDGGVLSSAWVNRIKLDKEELSEYSFFTKDKLPEEISLTLKNRVLAAWGQYEEGAAAYLENQS